MMTGKTADHICDMIDSSARIARDAALEFAAQLCDTIASNTKDFDRERRRGAGQCAALIRSHKTPPSQVNGQEKT